MAEGPWMEALLALPLLAALAAVALGRRAPFAAMVALPLGVALAMLLAGQVWQGGVAEVALGGHEAPLGIALRADGLAVALLLTTALVMAAVLVAARAEFATSTDGRTTLAWPLLLALWAGLNAAFLAGDLFTLYVALELLTLSAVPLVSLSGKAEAVAAALRYLLFALLGSILYLAGAALLYGATGTLDLVLLTERVTSTPAAYVAGGLMTAGLLAKAALLPLHAWLPPAHSAAPAAASAVLSALVIKAPFVVALRLWFDAMPELADARAAVLPGALGAAAILWGGALALRQERLKLAVAYSTVAQIGYLFLLFPLAGGGTEAQPWVAGAWSGAVLHALSHAFAKAAMFLFAGQVLHSAGHDRIAALGGLGRALPLGTFAFALAGLSLMGLPPSGGFVAKWLLLTAALAGGPWWAVPMLAGGLLAAGYVFRLLNRALAVPEADAAPFRPVPLWQQSIPFALAAVSVLLGLVPYGMHALLGIGRPQAAEEGL